MMPFHRSRTATTAWLGVLTVAVAACARPQAATGTRDEKAAAVARLKPTDSGSLAQTDARAHTPVAAGCVPTEHAEDIRRRLRAEAGEAFPFRRATPLLVDRWPDPTALVVYTYESRALPTGRVNHEIQEFQRNLADQNWALIGNLGYLDNAIAFQHRQPNSRVNPERNDASCSPGRSSAMAD